MNRGEKGRSEWRRLHTMWGLGALFGGKWEADGRSKHYHHNDGSLRGGCGRTPLRASAATPRRGKGLLPQLPMDEASAWSTCCVPVSPKRQERERSSASQNRMFWNS